MTSHVDVVWPASSRNKARWLIYRAVVAQLLHHRRCPNIIIIPYCSEERERESLPLRSLSLPSPPVVRVKFPESNFTGVKKNLPFPRHHFNRDIVSRLKRPPFLRLNSRSHSRGLCPPANCNSVQLQEKMLLCFIAHCETRRRQSYGKYFLVERYNRTLVIKIRFYHVD